MASNSSKAIPYVVLSLLFIVLGVEAMYNIEIDIESLLYLGA